MLKLKKRERKESEGFYEKKGVVWFLSAAMIRFIYESETDLRGDSSGLLLSVS